MLPATQSYKAAFVTTAAGTETKIQTEVDMIPTSTSVTVGGIA